MAFIDHPRYANIVSLTESLIQSIVDAQNTFYTANGRYFQGWPIPDGQPDGSTDLAIDNTAKPFSQIESWKDFSPSNFKNNTKLPYKMRIDLVSSGTNKGWRLLIEVWYPGIDPDEFGVYGDHWVYIHDESFETCPEYQVWDNWYITEEEF